MNPNTNYELTIKSENITDETVNEVVAFESFDEIEDIVTASGQGTIICCY